MIFDVVDPKEHTFDEWITKVEEFLQHYPEFERKEGDLYFTQDDVVDPWGEDSILYTVPGEEGGKIELRDGDDKVYLFVEEFAGRNLKDSKEGSQFHLCAPTTIYGFSHNSLGSSRFHEGPIHGVYFLYQGERAEYPQPITFERLWGGALFKAIYWINAQTNRLQDQKIKGEVDQVKQRFDLSVKFTHPALVNLVLEKIPNRMAIKEWGEGALNISWESPTLDQLKEFFECMPVEEASYEHLQMRLVWEASFEDAPPQEVTYLGVEKRKLKPFIHIPRIRSSKTFREHFKSHFKGYRVDRHDYLIEHIDLSAWENP